MAIYFTQNMNAAIASVLLIITIIFQFTASLYGGFLSDVIGRKKMIVTGEALKFVAFIGMCLANSPWWHSPWATFAMLTLTSISAGIIGPAASAMLVDVSSKETRVYMYSINYWATNFSLMIGIAIGGWFFKSNFFELLVSLIILSFLNMLITIFFIKETYKNSSKVSQGIRENYGFKSLFKNYNTVIRDIPFVLYTIAGISILTIEFQRNNFIAVRLEREFIPISIDILDLSLKIDGIRILSILTLENTILVMLLSGMISKFIKSKSENKMLYLGFGLFGLGFSLLSFSNNLLVLFASVFVLTIGEMVFVPVRQTILADIIDESKRGAYMAINGFTFQFGRMFGFLGITIGNIIGGVGMSILYGCLVTVSIIFSYLAIIGKKRRDEVSFENSG